MILEAGFLYTKIALGSGKYPFYKYMYIAEKSDYDKLHVRKIKYDKKGVDTIESEYIGEGAVEYFEFKHDKNDYICFYLLQEINSYKSFPVHRFIVKTSDIYQIGRKHFGDIVSLLDMQGVERTRIGSDAVSTSYLDEIITNKIDYIYFLKDKDLMPRIKLRNVADSDYNDRVTVPYLGRSNCMNSLIAFEGPCNSEDLVIIDRKKDSEKILQCYCIGGKVEFGLMDKECVVVDGNNNGKSISAEQMKKVNKLCNKVFDAINRLIYYRLVKMKLESDTAQYLISDMAYKADKMGGHIGEKMKKVILHILTSLANSKKKDVIDYINITYGKTIDYDVFTSPISDHSRKKDHYKTYDDFLRIDLVIGKDISVHNLESFTTDNLRLKYINGKVKGTESFHSGKQYLLKRIVMSNLKRFTETTYY